MTRFAYENQLWFLAFTAGAWLAAGALIGGFHFLTLRWSMGKLVTGQSPALVLAIQLVRFAAVAAVLSLVARRFGALPLLAAMAGVLAARTVVVRWGAQP